jgi:hypothetical protein
MQQPVGEHMAPFRVGTRLRLVERDERDLAVGRHRLRRAQEIAGALREDLLLAGDQADLALALDLDHAVVNLAREQAQRKAHHAGRVPAHALDGEMGLTRVGRAEDGGKSGAKRSAHGLKVGPKLPVNKRSLQHVIAPHETHETRRRSHVSEVHSSYRSKTIGSPQRTPPRRAFD